MVNRILVDANVLFSRTLRDWLFLLRNETEGQIYTVAATEDVIAETIYRYRRRHPGAPGQLITAIHDRIVEQLDERITDYVIDGSFPGNDVNDAHIHAAAISAGIDTLVTADRDFLDLPIRIKTSLPYLIQSPDEFFVSIDDLDPDAVTAVTIAQSSYWINRRGTADLPEYLSASDCPHFASRITARQMDESHSSPPVSC
jgi:predicted nucleic acid-binding protein